MPRKMNGRFNGPDSALGSGSMWSHELCIAASDFFYERLRIVRLTSVTPENELVAASCQ